MDDAGFSGFTFVSDEKEKEKPPHAKEEAGATKASDALLLPSLVGANQIVILREMSLFFDEMDESYCEFRVPANFADSVVGIADAALEYCTAPLGFNRTTIGLHLGTGRMYAASREDFDCLLTLMAPEERLYHLNLEPGNVVGLGIDNLGDVYVTHNGRLLNPHLGGRFHRLFPMARGHPAVSFRQHCDSLPELVEELAFDPETAEKTPENCPELPMSNQPDLFSRMPLSLLQHIFVCHTFEDDFIALSSLMLVCKRVLRALVLTNDIWRRLHALRFGITEHMRPVSWYRLFMFRLSNPAGDIENCDQLDCPRHFSRLARIDGMDHVRVCAQCSNQCEQMTSWSRFHRNKAKMIRTARPNPRQNKERKEKEQIGPTFLGLTYSLADEENDQTFHGFTYQAE